MNNLDEFRVRFRALRFRNRTVDSCLALRSGKVGLCDGTWNLLPFVDQYGVYQSLAL